MPTWKVTRKTLSSHPKTWLRATLSTCQLTSLKARQRDGWRWLKDEIINKVFHRNTALMQLHLLKLTEWHPHFHTERASSKQGRKHNSHQSQHLCSRAELREKVVSPWLAFNFYNIQLALVYTCCSIRQLDMLKYHYSLHNWISCLWSPSLPWIWALILIFATLTE